MRTISTIVCILVATGCLFADHKSRGRSAWAWAVSNSPVASSGPADDPIKKVAPAASESKDAIAEVNEARAKKGLPPLINDPLLAQAAYKAAQQRASRGINGHLPEGDFTCLPAGAKADVAGCAALDTSWGWQSCAWDEPQYTHAGAAWVMQGQLRYMHVFCRVEHAGAVAPKTSVEPVRETGTVTSSCASGSCGIQQTQYRSRRRR